MSSHEKVEESDTKDIKSDGKIISDHYNNITNDNLELRNVSRIFHQRNFNNWIKSVLIQDAVRRVKDAKFDDTINVLDVGCGKGGDLMKWDKSNISHIVCADIAERAVEKCEERYADLKSRKRNGSIFSAEFISTDCTRSQLCDLYKDKDMVFDIVSAQFSFHYCFESLEQTETMLENISKNLASGGYFIATTIDCFEAMKRLKAAPGLSFGNDVYNIRFESKENRPLFNAKYYFNLEGVVDCPEYLVYFPLLIELAKKYKLKLLFRKKLEDYFQENHDKYEPKQLLTRMTALETYPATRNKTLSGKPDMDYVDVEKQHKEILKKHSHERFTSVGTLSQAEWEVISLYVAILFQKE